MGLGDDFRVRFLLAQETKSPHYYHKQRLPTRPPRARSSLVALAQGRLNAYGNNVRSQVRGKIFLHPPIPSWSIARVETPFEVLQLRSAVQPRYVVFSIACASRTGILDESLAFARAGGGPWFSACVEREKGQGKGECFAGEEDAEGRRDDYGSKSVRTNKGCWFGTV